MLAGLLAEVKHSSDRFTNIPSELDLFEQPQRDSNPCLHLERVVSLASRRWGRVGARLERPREAPRRTAFLWERLIVASAPTARISDGEAGPSSRTGTVNAG
jgi:hypothetical protein